jgi:hypothetical protein
MTHAHAKPVVFTGAVMVPAAKPAPAVQSAACRVLRRKKGAKATRPK